MVVHLVCQCGNDFTVSDSLSGRKISCPKCGRKLSASSSADQHSDDDAQGMQNPTGQHQTVVMETGSQTEIVPTKVSNDSVPDMTTPQSTDEAMETLTVVPEPPQTNDETVIHVVGKTGNGASNTTPFFQDTIPREKLSERVLVDVSPGDDSPDATRIMEPSARPGSAKDDSGFDLSPSEKSDDDDATRYDNSPKESGKPAGQGGNLAGFGSNREARVGSQSGSQTGSKIAQIDLTERVMGTISRPSVPISLAPGNDNGDYGVHRILRTHQKGGMGRILIAYDQFLKRDIALKELHPQVAEDISIVRRFIGEAEITAQLEHPGIVPIHVLGRDREGLPYYTMKLIKGITYQEAIKAYHRNPTKQELMQLIRRLVSICKTIAFAHNKGVIHRDLKPANIMLGEHGETLVMDWGLAKPIGAPNTDETTYASVAIEHLSNEPRPELTMVGAVVGTPAFMSPEQASPEESTVGPLSDVFSLGTILYYLLAGQTAFSGRSTQEVLNKVRAASPPKPSEIKPNVPLGLEAICAKAMAKNPDDRYQNASEMDADLCRWLDGEPVKAQKENLMQRIHRWVDRHRILAFAIPFGIVLLIVFANLAIYFDRQGRSRTQEQAILTILTQSVDLTDAPSVHFRSSPGISVQREPRMIKGGDMVSCRVDVVPKSEQGIITIIAPGGGAWDLTRRNEMRFSAYEDLAPTQPKSEAPLSGLFIRMGRGSSYFEYTPDATWWESRNIRNWYTHTFLLDGSSSWKKTEHGEPQMNDIEWIEIHFTVRTPASFQLDDISFQEQEK